MGKGEVRSTTQDLPHTPTSHRYHLKHLSIIISQSNAKKTITQEEWSKKISSAKLRRDDINKLIMNFLVTEVPILILLLNIIIIPHHIMHFAIEFEYNTAFCKHLNENKIWKQFSTGVCRRCCCIPKRIKYRSRR